MKTRKGFTMIEMMVSIGIMLILSAAMTVSVVTYIQKTNIAKDKIQLHQDKFDLARAQVDGLLGSAGVITLAPTASPTPTTGGGDPVTPTSTPVPATPTPTATPAVTATPTPSPEPTLFPNAIPAVVKKVNNDKPYEYSAVLGVKSSYSYATVWTIVVPEGTINVKYWYNCTIKSIVGNVVTIEVEAYIANPAIKVDYNGDQSNWDALVTNVVAK